MRFQVIVEVTGSGVGAGLVDWLQEPGVLLGPAPGACCWTAQWVPPAAVGVLVLYSCGAAAEYVGGDWGGGFDGVAWSGDGVAGASREGWQDRKVSGAAVSGVVACLYGVFFVIVRDAEQAVVGGTDDTFPAYAALAVVYLVGAVLLTALERRWVWVTGAIVQVVVLGLFVLLGLGVFEHEALSDVPVAVWAAAITGLQLVLLGVLTYLAGARRGPALERPPD